MKFAAEPPQETTPSGECLKGQEFHAWDPDDFLYGGDPIWNFPDDNPARAAVGAVIRVLMACDRISHDGFHHIVSEVVESDVSTWELDFLEFHYQRRVLGWEHFLRRTGFDWNPSERPSGLSNATAALASLGAQAGLAKSGGWFTEFVTRQLEGIYRPFLASLIVLPAGTGLAPGVGELVIRSAIEHQYFSRWGAAVLPVAPRHVPSLTDHWIDGLLDLGLQIHDVPHPGGHPRQHKSIYAAHLRALANLYLAEDDLHIPPEAPAPAFLPWFEIRQPYSLDLLYRIRRATAHSNTLAGCDDDEL